jgi:hypothetical protein
VTDCDSGRTALFDGTWTAPCPEPAIHHIGSPAAEPIRLCEGHFQQILAAGLVKEPNLDPTEYQKRENARTKPASGKGFLRRGRS